MRIKINCECGETLETSTVYDVRVCMKCGKSYDINKETGEFALKGA